MQAKSLFKKFFRGLIFLLLAVLMWNYWTNQESDRYRFNSFAPLRNDSKVKWFVDGKDYMSAVADAIEAAHKEILITDWQMNPNIFMKRPDNGVDSLKWRLDKMLIRKASEDVKVYILLYWETKVALDLGSDHTISTLNKHHNIVVYRHPHRFNVLKHFFTKILWSHHEKLIIIDRRIAFVGGIDLCNGRWDTPSHELMDDYPLHPCTEEHCENMEAGNTYERYRRWVGKDYKNEFLSDRSKINWEKPNDDYEYINRSQIPRMPWHDVACAFTGDAVSDAVKHFRQRYYALNPSWCTWGLQDLPIELDVSDSKVLDTDDSLFTKANIQVLRSVDNWSAGQPHEASIYNAYLNAIENAEKYIYIENQFFISSQPDVENQIQSALADRIHRAYKNGEDFHVMIVMPLKTEFGPEDWKSNRPLNGLKRLSYWNYATLFTGKHSLTYRLKELNPDISVNSYFSIYGLRTHGLLGKNMATEIIYVHSKLMIVDDRVSIIGSANINDRSMLGGRDSEMAVIVEDVEMVEGKMKDKEWKVGKFSHSLRCRLLKEHLGLLNTENIVTSSKKVQDPLLQSFITEMSQQADKNNKIYEKVFGRRILPQNEVRNMDDLKKWMQEKGFVDTDQKLANEELKNIHGHIVTFPGLFLIDVLSSSIVDKTRVYRTAE
ncbi:phospholipase D1-like [Xenia sp. Carnegie-2017]|uniref:phospholipase D1-like n=1 Tax=Xenia sp. Carnegie-2017 TaxID=2897299 RepID=UPI001F03E5EE|nr:phospholipase D1-like [Xenia sp. Carnegie-2017]